MDNVLTTTMMLWNSRQDVEYYELQVLDAEMEPIRFATNEKIIRVPYLKRKTVNVYISARDKDRAVYVCSRSKILADNDSRTVVSSRICSKAK